GNGWGSAARDEWCSRGKCATRGTGPGKCGGRIERHGWVMPSEYQRQTPTDYKCEVCSKEQTGSLGTVLFPPGLVFVFPPGWSLIHARTKAGRVQESTTVSVCSETCATRYMGRACQVCCNPECKGQWGTGCYCCHWNHKDG